MQVVKNFWTITAPPCGSWTYIMKLRLDGMREDIKGYKNECVFAKEK